MQWYNNTTGSPHPNPCVHGDLTKIVPENSFDKDGCFFNRARQIDKAKFCAEQWCFQHGKPCKLFTPDAAVPDYDISGLPCPDMSRAGLRKFEEGKTSSVFACHAKMHVQWQTPMLVVENVQDGDLIQLFNLLNVMMISLSGKRQVHCNVKKMHKRNGHPNHLSL